MRHLILIIISFSLILFTTCGSIKNLADPDDSYVDPQPDPTTPPDEEEKPPVEMSTKWIDAADSAVFVLVDQFMNKEKGIFWGSKRNVLDNTRYLYWQEAHAMDALIYSYSRIKNSNPDLAQEYETYFNLWFDNRANNWDQKYPDDPTNGFQNHYVDDMAWITQVLLHMSEATEDEKYFDMAKLIYDELIITHGYSNNDGKGWGLPWQIGKGEANYGRNDCTNTPGCLISCMLYNKTGEEKYLEYAKEIYNFVNKNLFYPSGAIGEPPMTYTQGTWMEACRLLYHITKNQQYMTSAEKAAMFTMTGGRCTDNQAGVLRDEGNDNGNAIFKAVFVPHAVSLANDPWAQTTVRNRIKDFLELNAETMWLSNVDRSLYPEMFINYDWAKVYKVDENPGLLGAQTSGVSLLEGMTRLK